MLIITHTTGCVDVRRQQQSDAPVTAVQCGDGAVSRIDFRSFLLRPQTLQSGRRSGSKLCCWLMGRRKGGCGRFLSEVFPLNQHTQWTFLCGRIVHCSTRYNITDLDHISYWGPNLLNVCRYNGPMLNANIRISLEPMLVRTWAVPMLVVALIYQHWPDVGILSYYHTLK